MTVVIEFVQTNYSQKRAGGDLYGKTPMRIAQVAPLNESVPPKFYGGTERIVSYLTEECVRQGHDVTLFASGDSNTGAKLVPICPRCTCSSCRPRSWH